MVERDRFQRLWPSWRTPLEPTVVRQNHVMELHGLSGRKIRYRTDGLRHLLGADYHVAKEPTGVGVLHPVLAPQFLKLAEVVEQDPRGQQVGVDFRLELDQRAAEAQDLEDVFQQPAAVGVMHATPGR